MYVRDKRSPIPKSEAVSRVMSANKQKNTAPEINLRRALWKAGVRGYRVHYKKAPGQPDISFVGRKVAVFVHGCFWHRCPTCKYKLPMNNQLYWKTKFDKNVARDRKTRRALRKAGWTVIVIWECKAKKRLSSAVRSIMRVLEKQS